MKKEKIILWTITLLALAVLVTSDYQHYEGEWEADMWDDAVTLAISRCQEKGKTATECINDLIKDEVDEGYKSNRTVEMSKEWSRILSSGNYTSINEAIECLEGIDT